MTPPKNSPCKHQNLHYDPSPHAREVGYKPLTPLQNLAATLPSNKAPTKAHRERFGPHENQYPPSTFPAPLVLPGDELSWNPIDEQPQNLKNWIEGSHRNAVTKSRRTIYLVASPKIDPSVAYVNEWSNPQLPAAHTGLPVEKPRIEDLQSYLKAFYHPLSIKLLPSSHLKYVPWSTTNNPSSKKASSSPSRIGLRTPSSVFGIRHRPSSDKLFAGQLNLNDLLDVAMAILPRDAYALCMLTDHDLYEDEEDDFCCGRAYGGSRVCVVSSARYNPLLDAVQKVEVEHAWPNSHCQAYIDERCGSSVTKKKKRKGQPDTPGPSPSAMQGAVNAASSSPPLQSPTTSQTHHRNLYLSRLCKTTSHELGHCLGIAHCSYYACIMQSTAGLSEDARQPPYLCPVDLKKVLWATGADAGERYRALEGFCEGMGKVDGGGGGGMFGGFGAWLGVRNWEVEREREREREVIVLD